MGRRIGKWLLAAVAMLVAAVTVWVVVGAVVYSPEYAWRVVSMRKSSQLDYLERFPLSRLSASTDPFVFEKAIDEERVRRGFESIFGVDDFDAFLASTGTQAFIVIENDRILYERYFNGAARDSMLTSFSVAKSFDSVLIGIALEEGFIGGVDDPITDYLPELAQRDARFAAITIRDLLLMASGLDYQAIRWGLFNGDDPLTTYALDQRQLALDNTTVIDQPGEYFSYNKYHPQLLGMILERATGMSVTEYTQTRLWDKVGMEFDGAWALDGETSRFEKMEAGLNARAIDYVKLGRLFLERGVWNGEQVVSDGWVGESTVLDPSTHHADYYPDHWGQIVYADGGGYYKYMWYGALRDAGEYDFYAAGDHGQYVYVSPVADMIIVRNGTEFGIPSAEWTDAFFAFASG